MISTDRYDVAVAFQIWQKFFSLALYGNGVSNKDELWMEHRDTALEYLARGRLMQIMGAFCDGVLTGVSEQAEKGMALIRDDVPELVSELDASEAEARKLLKAHCMDLQEQGIDAVRREVARTVEMRAEHRAWFGDAPELELPDTSVGAPPVLPAVELLVAAPSPLEAAAAEERRIRSFWR